MFNHSAFIFYHSQYLIFQEAYKNCIFYRSERTEEAPPQTNGTKATDSETSLSAENIEKSVEGENNEINHKVNGNNGSVKELSEDGSNNNDVKSIIFA